MLNLFTIKQIKKILLRFSFARFCIVGGTMFCFDASILYACMYGLQLSPTVARIISSICSVTLSWSLHRSYTFGPSRFKMLLEYRKYIICSLLSFVINLSVYILLVNKLLIFWQYPILALVLATATSMNFSYFFMKKLVFLKKEI